MARKLDCSINSDEIQDLYNNKIDYVHLKLYVKVFDISGDIRTIFKMRNINNLKVKIEAIRRNKFVA